MRPSRNAPAGRRASPLRGARLARLEPGERRVAFVVANHPARDGRLANGVGLDTPASLALALARLREEGYDLGESSESAGGGKGGAAVSETLLTGAGLIARLQSIASNAGPERPAEVVLAAADYERFWQALPGSVRRAVEERWGPPESDPFWRDAGSAEGGLPEGGFAVSGFRSGKIFVGIQPSRGYHLDPAATYHDPSLPPPHGYLAFYAWLRANADCAVQFGKHGSLEWLPGKSVALSRDCHPDALLGPLPLLYPFIVNDPGEGTQAKRRTAAVVLDHLTPPLARAGSYGPLAELESRLDEYYEAAALDPRRAALLEGELLETARRLGLDEDIALPPETPAASAQPEAFASADTNRQLTALDNHLCELKELQIRAGLHIYGAPPPAEAEGELLAALLRSPRGSEPQDRSLLDALAEDLGLPFRPLELTGEAPLAAAYDGPRPAALQEALSAANAPPEAAEAAGAPEAAGGEGGGAPWRTVGDTIERLEALVLALVEGRRGPEPEWRAARVVLELLEARLRPALAASAAGEAQGLLTGLAGGFVAPGPSGAPSRGRPEVLPTGRNFYSLDPRAVPTPSAWQLGWRSASLLVERYRRDHGSWPRQLALSAWGTANLRTGGDDIAQALALMGVRPLWDAASRRVTGFEVMPLEVLARPRVDLTLRISGFFRDAFPAQIALLDSAVRAVAALDEPESGNPLAANAARDAAAWQKEGLAAEAAEERARRRIFGSAPGSYGAGLQALIDSGAWREEADLARAWLGWSGYAYGAGGYGDSDEAGLAANLARTQAVVHNQDNREHDLLDSDDYYQFEGGLSAAVHALSHKRPAVYHNDHARPWAPKVRSLGEELGRVVRGRAANPKWIGAMMRHGYKGAFEIAATVDYLFAFAATTGAVRRHHFSALFDAYLADEEVRDFLAEANPSALAEIAERFAEARERGLWQDRSNRVQDILTRLLGEGARGAGRELPEQEGARGPEQEGARGLEHGAANGAGRGGANGTERESANGVERDRAGESAVGEAEGAAMGVEAAREGDRA